MRESTVGRDTKSRGPTGSHASRAEASCPVWASIFPPVPGSPDPSLRGGGCPLLLQGAAPIRTLRAQSGSPSALPKMTDTRAPSPGRCRSAALAVSYRVCGRRRRNERAESGLRRARPGAPTRATGDWLSRAGLQRERGGAGPGRGGAAGRSSVTEARTGACQQQT